MAVVVAVLIARRLAVVIVIVGIIAIVAALLALFVEAGAVFIEDAKVMFGVLQEIFHLHAVAGELRVSRHALVLLEQLRGIAALPVILAIAPGLSPEALVPLSPATAPAAATLTIVDQMSTSLKAEACPDFALSPDRRMRAGLTLIVPNSALKRGRTAD